MAQPQTNSSKSNLKSFFLIVPPHFEKLAKIELVQKWGLITAPFTTEEMPSLPLPEISIVHGGLALDLPPLVGLRLNCWLKIPTRILLRLVEFKCRDFPKLYNKMKKFDWSPYLLGKAPQIKATCRESRLTHTGRIESAITEGIRDYFIGQPPKQKWVDLSKTENQKSNQQTLFVRFNEDLCTLSLDTSGERLDRRGVKTLVGEAPLRENLAQGLLLLLSEELRIKKNKEAFALIDPMLGSGTFLSEAMTYSNPSIKRTFAFATFPFYITANPSLIKKPEADAMPASSFTSYIGIEQDRKTANIAIRQLKKLNIPCLDIFIQSFATPLPIAIPEKNVMILNPPYGERLELPQGENGKTYYKKLCVDLTKIYRPTLLGMVVPSAYSKFATTPKNYSLTKKLNFSNGGIDCDFLIFSKE